MGLKLMAEIGLDGSGFERGLRKVGEEAAASVKNLAIQAFGIYGVEQAIAKTVETATELVNESKRLDVTIEQMQLLREVAKDAGVDVDTLAGSFEKINLARSRALSGDKSALAAFARLGVTGGQLQNATAMDMFSGPISNAARSNNVSAIASSLEEVLGRGFGQVMPALRTDFDEARDKLEKFGLITDALTAVKLKNMGDEFDMIGKIITTVLGPSLVRLADWIMTMIVNSPLVESVDFLAKRSQELSKVPDFTTADGKTLSAEARSEAADDFRTHLLDAINNKTTWEEFRRQYKYVLTQGVFSDFKGNSFKEFQKYLSDISLPVIDATQKAAKGSTADMAGLQKMVADWQEKMKKAADELEHPKPPGADDNKKVPDAKASRFPAMTDSLLRVGNFLAANGNTISRVDQQKITLLKKIADNTTPKATFGTNFGIPPV